MKYSQCSFNTKAHRCQFLIVPWPFVSNPQDDDAVEAVDVPGFCCFFHRMTVAAVAESVLLLCLHVLQDEKNAVGIRLDRRRRRHGTAVVVVPLRVMPVLVRATGRMVVERILPPSRHCRHLPIASVLTWLILNLCFLFGLDVTTAHEVS
jgi:hypothetical protein